jgi:hypothetical protein
MSIKINAAARLLGAWDLFEEVKRKKAARESLADKLVKEYGTHGSVAFNHPSGRTALAGPDASKHGGYRITWFDHSGHPIGHGERPNLREAILEALKEGFTPQH